MEGGSIQVTSTDGHRPVLIFRSLGLIGDPFGVWRADEGDSLPLALSTHAAANRLYSALVDGVSQERSTPVWAEKPLDKSAFLAIRTTGEILHTLTQDDSFGVLPAYAQLQTMRGGRVRGALAALADKLAGAGFDLTLAAWTRGALAAPDTELPEWGPLAAADLDLLMELLERAPAETAEEVYGPLASEREGLRDDLEVLLRIGEARRARQEDDPEETDDADEDDSDDPGREVFAEPLGPETAAAIADGRRAGGDRGPLAADVAAYVVAYTAKNLSPVMGRALRAYIAQGTSSAAQEMRVTKAPRKTLGALARFAGARFGKVALIWDRFDGWDSISPDMRMKIALALTEMRWGLAEHGILVILAEPGLAPELEEQFAAAKRVSWDMSDQDVFEAMGDAYDEDLVRVWLESAALPGARVWTSADEPFATLAAECGGSLERFARAASAAVVCAAERAAESFGEEDLAAGRAALAEGA